MRESEERRKRRRRDTGPDVVGMEIKRDLLVRAVDDQPSADDFEAWLMERVIESDSPGAVRAMALDILFEFQNAAGSAQFVAWLEAGAPTPGAGRTKLRNRRG